MTKKHSDLLLKHPQLSATDILYENFVYALENSEDLESDRKRVCHVVWEMSNHHDRIAFDLTQLYNKLRNFKSEKNVEELAKHD